MPSAPRPRGRFSLLRGKVFPVVVRAAPCPRGGDDRRCASSNDDQMWESRRAMPHTGRCLCSVLAIVLASCSATPGDSADPAVTASASTSTELSATATPVTGDVPAFEVSSSDGELFDATRQRRVPYRVFAPIGVDGPTPVVVVSHGGQGNEWAWMLNNTLGKTIAANGFVSFHIGHLPSTDLDTHLRDRPADVTFLLDRIEADAIALPASFDGTADTTRVGHAGHSFGAYTSHALGGATFTHGTHSDRRILAIAPISPQGVGGGFGGFDNGDDDSTWATVDVPAYNLIGGDEIDTNATATVDEPGWRRTPFEHYTADADRFLTIIDGQDHQDMYNGGSDDVKRFIATEIARFFRAYLTDGALIDACAIGTGRDGTATERVPARQHSKIDDCT